MWIGFNALDFVLIYINAFGVDSNAKLGGSSALLVAYSARVPPGRYSALSVLTWQQPAAWRSG